MSYQTYKLLKMSTQKYSRLSLNEIENNQCLKKCSKEFRQQYTDEDLCSEVLSASDGLRVRCVGEWSFKKIYSLTQYFNTFSIAMYRRWKSINYVEICSGPGRCINRKDGIEFNGTALSIIESKGFNVLNKAIFFDYNEEIIASLNLRFKQRGIGDKAIALMGNYHTTDILQNIERHLPNDGLTLIFIDPTDLSITFDFIIELKRYLKNIDLIINCAVGTDFNRNIRNILLKSENYESVYRKYVSFLGSDDFFQNPELIFLAESGNSKELRSLFRDAYKKNLQNLGFEYFDPIGIEHYYDILYCTKSQTGLKLWKNAHAIDIDGQRKLF